MPRGTFGYFVEVAGPVDPDFGIKPPVDPDYGIPEGPPHISIPIPPLPPGIVAPPIALPPVGVPPGHPPIVIPQPPDKPLPGPPAVIWPPLPPGTGVAGKCLILVWVVGVGSRWLVIEGPDVWPPVATPKG